MTLAGLAATGFSLALIEEEPEAQLWARRDHDPMPIRELGRRYSDFARRVVRSYVHHRKIPGRYRMDELLSAGHVGLMSAVRRFEPERGWKFETFAARRIRGAVKDELRSTPPPVAGDGTENEQRVCPFGDRGIQLFCDEDLERLREARKKLEPRGNEILHLTFDKQLDVREAAWLMNPYTLPIADIIRAGLCDQVRGVQFMCMDGNPSTPPTRKGESGGNASTPPMGHDWQDWSPEDWMRIVPGHVACVNASMQGAPRGDTHLTQHISLCAGIEQWPEKVWLSPSVIGRRFGRIVPDVRDGAPWDLLPVPDGLHTLTNLTGWDELNHRGGLTPLDLPEDTPFWFAPGTPSKTCYSQVTLR